MIVAGACSLAATAVACGNPQSEQIVTVSPTEFDRAISADSTCQLLDVRSAAEYSEGHIKGAVNIDVLQPGFIDKAEKELTLESPVYVYCRSGRRSMTAAELLARKGYRVVNLDGGILGWEKDDLPVTHSDL